MTDNRNGYISALFVGGPSDGARWNIEVGRRTITVPVYDDGHGNEVWGIELQYGEAVPPAVRHQTYRRTDLRVGTESFAFFFPEDEPAPDPQEVVHRLREGYRRASE